MSSEQWSLWMRAAQGGDAVAYRRLLGEAASWLRRYFARRLPPAMIDDAVQDTLLAVHEKRHTYAPDRAFAPWLAAIARYKWIDRLRAITASATVALDEDIAVPGHEDPVGAAHTLGTLLEAIRPAQAEVIRLVKLQGFSVEEASRRTGQSVSLVKVNIHRGLGRMSALARRDERETRNDVG